MTSTMISTASPKLVGYMPDAGDRDALRRLADERDLEIARTFTETDDSFAELDKAVNFARRRKASLGIARLDIQDRAVLDCVFASGLPLIVVDCPEKTGSASDRHLVEQVADGQRRWRDRSPARHGKRWHNSRLASLDPDSIFPNAPTMAVRLCLAFPLIGRSGAL
jgi:hypothetical protein